ncbi:MAG: WD40 repeat domain-containing protein, partial [Pleurocapsa sp.]
DMIVSGSYYNTIKFLYFATGKFEITLTGHSDSVNSVAISEDRIVSGSSDNTIKIWQLKQHKFCILTDC